MKSLLKIDTVIFDLDGTLLDTLEDLTIAANYALNAFNMPAHTIDEIRQFVGNGVRKLMLRAVPQGEAHPDFEKVFAVFKDYYGKHCKDKTRAYEGIPELLQDLKRSGYALAIVSNKIDSAVQELKCEYFPQVGVAVGDREGLRNKPAPDSVYAALEQLGRTKEHAVYIGDSEVDLQTAKNAGIPCISVLWGFRDKAFLQEHGADTFVEKPQEVPNLLADMNNMSENCHQSVNPVKI